MNPELLAAIAYYLAQNCSADIRLHCGPVGRAPVGPCSVESSEELAQGRGADPCPEIDYSNPNQPYFWDHTEMCH